MLDPITVFVLKVGALGVAAGALLAQGVQGLTGQLTVESVGGALGIGGFAIATSFAMWRLLRDDKLTNNAEKQRDYEKQRADELSSKLDEAQSELGKYRSRFGPLD